MRWSFVSNLAGRLWLSVMNLVAVPVYVRLLGANAYGIVSLVATFQAVLGLLDFGLSGTANRELAMARADGNGGIIANTVRTFEFIYWSVAIVIGICFVASSHWLATSWLPRQSLPPADIQLAIALGGLAMAARWPASLYNGILQGLERQVLQNGILVVAATLRISITIIAIVFFVRTVYCFLVAQAVSNMLEVLLIGTIARRLARTDSQARFDVDVVRRVWRFAIGFNLIGAFGMLVSGAPQLLISKLLPLDELTYYSLASTAAGVLLVISTAAQNTLFPRFSACWQRQEFAEIQKLYAISLRFTVYICAAPLAVLYFFPSEVVSLWTHSPELARHVAAVLPILAIAVMANCAVGIPYILVVASGHTRLPVLMNAISFPIMLAGCYFAIRLSGVSGAAWCWLAFNILCFIYYGQHCIANILPSGRRYHLYGFPAQFLLASAAVGSLSRLLMPLHCGNATQVLWLAVTMLAANLVQIPTLKAEERCMIVAAFKRYASSLSFKAVKAY